ncbi:MAG: nuclear transport factor 2 family protein [Bacteroidales bacterium]|nr:nuclear transport factor 2 family protein [Bacteroidales bacterium]
MKNLIVCLMFFCVAFTSCNCDKKEKCTDNKAEQTENKTTMNYTEQEKTDIMKAVELYAEAGRKGSKELGEKAFTKNATMSWVEDNKIVTVPISALFEALGQTGEQEVSYELRELNVAGDIAFVRIESHFSKLSDYDDMFTLAKGENGEWKIVSKIYHDKNKK